MYQEFNTWFSSLGSWQQVLIMLLMIVVMIIIRWMITEIISDGVAKGVKKAHKELIDEYKNKMDKEEG